jgi:hypothetical protein
MPIYFLADIHFGKIADCHRAYFIDGGGIP